MADEKNEVRHFLDLDVLPPETLRKIIETSRALKRGEFPNGNRKPLADKALAMIFEKPSTRTRVSFETGVAQARPTLSCMAAVAAGSSTTTWPRPTTSRPQT